MHWLTSQFVQIDDTAHALPSARTPCSSILLSFPSASHLQRTIYRTFLCLLHISRHTVREQRSDMACDSCFRDVIVLPCDWGHECWLLGLLRRMAAKNTAEGTDRRCMLGILLMCHVSVPHAYSDRCCGISDRCCAFLATPGFCVSQVLPPIVHEAVVLKQNSLTVRLRAESLLVGLPSSYKCHGPESVFCREVGWLRYYTLQQIPNFLLAAPVLLLAVAASVSYYRRQWSVVLVESLPRCFRSVVTCRISPHASPFMSTKLLPAIHLHTLQAFLLITTCHVQISLRQACTDPVLYWYLAHLSLQESPFASIWIGYTVVWGAISTALWTAHYPPA